MKITVGMKSGRANWRQPLGAPPDPFRPDRMGAAMPCRVLVGRVMVHAGSLVGPIPVVIEEPAGLLFQDERSLALEGWWGRRVPMG